MEMVFYLYYVIYFKCMKLLRNVCVHIYNLSAKCRATQKQLNAIAVSAF